MIFRVTQISCSIFEAVGPNKFSIAPRIHRLIVGDELEIFMKDNGFMRAKIVELKKGDAKLRKSGYPWLVTVTLRRL